MKRSSLVIALGTALLLGAVPLTAKVQAGTGIQRCATADGGSLWTDQPCAVHGAQALHVSADLSNRIATAQAQERRARAAAMDEAGLDPVEAAFTSEFPDAGMPAAGAATPTRRPVNAGCARSPQQLALDLRGAIALGDINRLAESYAWMGVSHAAGQRILDRLQSLLQREVLNAQYYGGMRASLSSTAAVWDDASGGWVETAVTTHSAPTIDGDGILQLTVAGEGGGHRSIDFRVREYADCWFVEYRA